MRSPDRENNHLNMDSYYYSFNNYLKKRFKTKVRRISLNAGFGCPHRNKESGQEGCFYCNEQGFAGFQDTSLDLKQQIADSIAIFKKQFKAEKFIAYFQNATNTNAPADELKKTYDVIKDFDQIVGISISTRPDCIDQEKLKLIDSYCDNYDVWLEYGLQSVHNRSLELLNRKHSFEDFLKAVKQTENTRIKMAAHVILGIPGESAAEMIKTAEELSKLPIEAVKVHIFHVLAGTRFADLYKQENFKIISEKEYIRFVCDFLEHLKADCAIMRLVSEARQEILLAPQWMNHKHKLLHAINREFESRKTRQGSYAQV
jgi:radical SAM protein (TIGR01212 family)